MFYPLTKIIAVTAWLIFLVVFVRGGLAAEPNIYSDPRRGFSLEVPEGWEVTSTEGKDVAVILKKPSPLMPFDASVIVTLIDQALPMPVNGEELKLIVQQISGPSMNVPNIGNYRVVSSKLDRRKGEAAFFYQVSYELTRVKATKDRKVKTLNYIFSEKGRRFALSLVAPAPQYKKMEKIFYKVIDSIRVGEPEPETRPKKIKQ